MKTKELLQKLEGTQTINSIMSILNVDRKKAIYCIHRLRKKGYVKTLRKSNKKRVYYISFENSLKGISYYDIINKYSPIKLVVPENAYRIYGKEPSVEETLVFAIKTKSVRTILSALSLFAHVKDWPELYRLAKINYVERQVGALYYLARQSMKTHRMPLKFKNHTLPNKDYKFEFVVDGLKSKDFKDIEKKWKVYLPFNKKDLEAYK